MPKSPPSGLTWAAVALVAMPLLAYAPALSAGFIWDDDAYVTANRALRDGYGLWRIWTQPGAVPQYYPLTFTSLWLQWQLAGDTPLSYHLVNVLLHGVNAVLVWTVLRWLGVPGAWWTAALFALHPVHVESVAWVTERKNVLSGVFFFGALAAWLRGEGIGGPPARWGSTVALTAFGAALLSKTVACTLPGALGLVLWWRGELSVSALRRLVPMIGLGLGLATVTIWMERHHVGAVGADWALAPIDRVLVAGRAAWFYAASLVWPVNLSFNYPRWQLNPADPIQLAYPVALVAGLAGLLLAAPRIGRGPFVAVAFFVGTLTPALGFFDVFPFRYSFVADHFQYHASLGLLAIAGVLLARLPTAAGGAVLALLATLTWQQSHAYADLETLWRDTIAKNPASWMAHNNLGMLLAARGDLPEAIVHYERALAAKPDDSYALVNLGIAFDRSGRPDEALARFQTAVRVDPDNAEAHLDLGNSLAAKRQLDAARAEYLTAIRIRPNYPDAYGNLGNLLAGAGDLSGARRQYETALELDPEYADAHRNLGALLTRAGDTDGARAHLAAAARLQPGGGDAEYELAGALAAQGRLADAVTHYQAAIRARPSFADAYNGLGAALAGLGKTNDSIDAFRAAVRLAPQSVDSLTNLGLVLAMAGRFEEAGPVLDHARGLGPPTASLLYQLARVRAGTGKAAEARQLFDEAERTARADGQSALTAEIARERATLPQ